MGIYKIQFIETISVLFIYIISYYITSTFINNTLKNTDLQRGRRKIIIKAVYLLITITTVIVLSAIWGLNQNEIVLFLSTILTALGIAFFAQWSLLSNITSGIILFFNHPLKIGDTIKVLDKEYSIEGEVLDLTYFFIHLKISDKEIITIPNSILLQKSISVIGKPEVLK